MPTLPVIDDNGNDDHGSNGNDNNSNNINPGKNNSNSNPNINNDKKRNDVVNNVVEEVQTLLPKTAAQNLTWISVVSIILTSLAGVMIWKSRK
ncbi:LPXTG cell wall anchor domain-containing protein [Weissella coleopterorum]|uniref:LPXTG cell wall anchor domain-containing protein n=2 Tax=Weissella coleopterorum TaxID=2714949 RepID=A0A6G8B0J2_9LACO|nr:LPXTG cell wall anchor domain-containing protein [Weissella coleopterorum]